MVVVFPPAASVVAGCEVGERWGVGSAVVLGQRPPSVLPGESEVDQPAQVQPGQSQVQPEVPRGRAPVAQCSTAALGSDQPGDGAFHHGTVLSVGLAELAVLAPLAAGVA